MLTPCTEKTTLAGKFSREINCLPVWTDETKYILKTMADDAMKPKVSTSIVKSFDPSGVIQAGAHVANDKFSNLVVSVLSLFQHIVDKATLTTATAHGSGAKEKQEAEGREGGPVAAERTARSHLPVLRPIRLLVTQSVQASLASARGMAA